MEPLPIGDYNRYPKETERFNRDAADHEMTVLHDDGLYRHLRFKSPERGEYWFDLITAPGSLTIDGDMGTFMFKRETDMFPWFGSDRDSINPGYWSEKLRAANYGRYDGNPVRKYNGTEFRKWVFERFWDDSRDMDADKAAKAWRLIRETIFESWYSKNKSNPDSEYEAVDRIRNFHDHHENDTGYEFYDWGEAVNTWQDFTVHYLWNCHAIVAGIRAYRAAKDE